MTTLVEKVARTLCKHACLGWSDEPDGNGDYFCDAARAALAVVHAHYGDPANVSDAMVEAFLMSEQDGSPDAIESTRHAIAAAMKAALTES